MLKVSILKILVVLITCISSLKLRGVFQKYSSFVCFAPEYIYQFTIHSCFKIYVVAISGKEITSYLQIIVWPS